MRRLQTQMPYREFQQGPKTSPGFRAFRRVTKQIEGPVFFDTFSQNDQTKCARPEALMDIRNTLAQEHYGTRLGSPLRGRTAPRVQSSIVEIHGSRGAPLNDYNLDLQIKTFFFFGCLVL